MVMGESNKAILTEMARVYDYSCHLTDVYLIEFDEKCREKKGILKHSEYTHINVYHANFMIITQLHLVLYVI